MQAQSATRRRCREGLTRRLGGVIVDIGRALGVSAETSPGDASVHLKDGAIVRRQPVFEQANRAIHFLCYTVTQ